MKRAVMIWMSLFGWLLLFKASRLSAALKDSGNLTSMVYIPEGSFTPFIQAVSSSQQVKIKGFMMDKYAVTNKQFLAFVKANPQWARSRVPQLLADEHYLEQWKQDEQIGDPRIENSPVTNISWFAASAYAKWAGKRLPTLQEWEYVMRAPAVNLPKTETMTAYLLNWYGRPTPQLIPSVGSTYKNKMGVYDMAGLVWEWVYDFNSVVKGSDSRSQGTLQKSLFCASGSQNVLNKEDYAGFMRFGFRASLKARYCIRNLGFRCAMDAKSP